MEKLFNAFSVAVGFLGGICARIFGAWDILLAALMAAMVLDYISGLIKAVRKKELSSEIGFIGLLKKVSILLVVAAANIVQNIVGDHLAIREIVIMFYIANELISLLENAAEGSAKIPQALKDILLQLRDKNGGKNNDYSAEPNNGQSNEKE